MQTLGMAWAAVAFAVVLGVAIGVLSMRACDGPSPVPVEVGIDAGPGEAEIDARLDAAVQADEMAIRKLEELNRSDLARFDEEQEREYREVRSRGRVALAAWFSAYNTTLKTDAGVGSASEARP